MKYRIYSVYDSAQETYGIPFFMINDKVAIRDFQIGMKKIDSDMKSDFSLYFLGSWDNFTSEVNFEAKPKLVCSQGVDNE